MKEIRKRGSYRLKKQILSALLSAVVIVGIFSDCRNGLAEQTAPTQSTFPTQKQESTVQDILEHGASVSEEKAETVRAREMGLIPQEWEKDLSSEADFTGFYQLMTSLVMLCDESALPVLQQNVDTSAFPQRTMRRDDGLILLMLTAEALGYNCYNAREYGFCTEYLVN